jgi:hypothetical protein
LLSLEEIRAKSQSKFETHQHIEKHWFDKKYIGEKEFQVGDLVLKWDKPHEDKGKHSSSDKFGLVLTLSNKRLAMAPSSCKTFNGKLILSSLMAKFSSTISASLQGCCSLVHK